MRKMICILLLLGVLTFPALAADLDEVMDSQSEALDLDELEEAGEDYLHGVTLDDVDLNEGLMTILDTGSEQLRGVLRKACNSGVLLLSVVLLAGVAESVLGGVKSRGIPVVPLAGALAITAISVADMESLLGLGQKTVSSMTDFANILFPAVTALSAATGAITGGAVRQMAALAFSDILLNMMDRFLMPLVYAYLAASVAHAALGNDGLKRLASFFKWAVSLILAILLIAFVGYLTLSGAIAGHADAATVKATKFALSSTIPVVGGILSDAAETVLAGAGILRGTVGLYGMLAILAMCIAPFLQLGMHYLIYKLTAALSSTVADSRMTGLIDSIGVAFGLILGMTGAGALGLLVSLISSLTVMNL